MANPPPEQPARKDERVERVLTEEVARIQTCADAERVAQRLERLAAGRTVQEQGKRAAKSDEPSGQAVQEAARRGAGPDGAAAALTEAAAQVVAPTPQAPQAAEAAVHALPPNGDAATREASRGRQLLREALLRRMGRLQAWDTRLFLAVNGLPHPVMANIAADTITLATSGGWIWLIGLAVARVAGVRDSRRAFRLAALSVIGATAAVEWPIKALFRRRRPFIDVVRALVIGRRPDGWSFPSGHTAAAFSGAWVLSTVWPRKAPVFFLLASTVGFSRIYVGAHYPGDVLSGATFGMVIAEAIRRPAARLLGKRGRRRRR